ncbi:RagB/SusD family nutrient uptake outer membrane protein [Sphingobacterium gobiense]|uniref:RagB/SusD family nutrient uptake outer membrane protein n=1 Tax=Sphingobacterium gobiense TaxID=1382456 RepID=A0A2S9JTJ7_9SPHI|nr:RagB/SusD family nutrient uptake outer membrane protein [Sphingobacterium gobiense]PRD56602.1 RagB/SusD family nutrient uptake outer membrane protein [Sphingobacterium gobiense]
MENINKLYRIILMIITLSCLSCNDDFLDRQPRTELGAAAFWQTTQDATTALMGAYSDVRSLFEWDLWWDGQGEYQRVLNTTAIARSPGMTDGSFNPSGYGGAFNTLYRELYGGVHRTNYVIENVERMLLENTSPDVTEELEAIIGEARLLRGMVYFRLISLWGDVPYIGKIIYDNSEVEDITRMPIKQIKDSIYADFTYASEKLPDQIPALGRAAKPAALAFRGKLQLYWASWNNFGWPELDGFVPDPDEARTAYVGAADDFRRVIQDFGLTLFRNGEPGDIDELGKAEILPNYFDLFLPTANGDSEIIMSFTHGGQGSGQGESLMRALGGRQLMSGQLQVFPRFEIADRYQSTITGDFVEPLIPMNPSNPEARTTENSAINPQSYANRDYRMKASILWDYEMIMGIVNFQYDGWTPFIYKTWTSPVTIDGVNYITYTGHGTALSGYVYRKFLRNYPGADRASGDYAWPVMRLADVYLMYAEATNEAYGPQQVAVDLVNRIRHRGNLPPLNAEKYTSKEDFFDAIEQERIIELLGEGHRSFDLRRWRAIERVWVPPFSPGVWCIDSHGANVTRYFNNASERAYEQCYIFRIPPAERDRNPNLTQNTPWM